MPVNVAHHQELLADLYTVAKTGLLLKCTLEVTISSVCTCYTSSREALWASHNGWDRKQMFQARKSDCRPLHCPLHCGWDRTKTLIYIRKAIKLSLYMLHTMKVAQTLAQWLRQQSVHKVYQLHLNTIQAATKQHRYLIKTWDSALFPVIYNEE